MKQAGIYVNDTYCGVLTEDEEGFHFVYDKNFSLIDSGNGEYNLLRPTTCWPCCWPTLLTLRRWP